MKCMYNCGPIETFRIQIRRSITAFRIVQYNLPKAFVNVEIILIQAKIKDALIIVAWTRWSTSCTTVDSFSNCVLHYYLVFAWSLSISLPCKICMFLCWSRCLCCCYNIFNVPVHMVILINSPRLTNSRYPSIFSVTPQWVILQMIIPNIEHTINQVL